jgi:hypothetical protein
VAFRDTEKERQRLLDRYAGMTEEELQLVSADWKLLTDVARSALGSELRRRGMDVPAAEQENENEEIRGTLLPPPIIIRRFLFLADALMAKTILDSAGVGCYLADENIVRLDWFYSNLVGGVKVWVRPDDSSAAIDLLNQQSIEKFEVEGIGEYLQPACTVCKSTDTSYYAPNMRMVFWSLFLFSPGILVIPRRRSRWKCNSCGQTWLEVEN